MCCAPRLGRGAGAAVPAQYRARLGHRRIRHAAALDPYPHRPRGGARQAERPHPGDPAADRPQPARGHRSGGARRAADPHRLRCAAGRWRHPHRRRSPAAMSRCIRRWRGWSSAGLLPALPLPTASRRSRAASSPARPCSTSIMPRIRQPMTDANFVLTGSGRHRRDPGDRRGRAVRRGEVRARCCALAPRAASPS